MSIYRMIGWSRGWKVYLPRRRNLLGEPHANVISSGAEPDQLFPFGSTDPILLFIMLLNVPYRFSVDTFKIFIYQRLFIQKVVRQNDTRSIT